MAIAPHSVSTRGESRILTAIQERQKIEIAFCKQRHHVVQPQQKASEGGANTVANLDAEELNQHLFQSPGSAYLRKQTIALKAFVNTTGVLQKCLAFFQKKSAVLYHPSFQTRIVLSALALAINLPVR
jgi:hypothetical protein